jgi:flagellar hook-length control protein FliK
VALDSILSTPVIPPPPKGATAPAGGNSSNGSSSSASGSDGSRSSSSSTASAGAANPSASASPGAKAAKNPGKSNSNSNSTQGQNASAARNKAQQKSAADRAQGASSAAAARNAATQNKNQGPSFIQALAQTQADAQDSATATVAAAPQEFTNTKPKGAKNDPDTIGTALGFLPQSLAAAMAGLQQASAGQNLPSNTSTSDDDSTDAVSLAGGGRSGGSAIQSVIANMAKDTAEELAHGSAGLKTATDDKADPSPAPTTDNTAAAAANAFQAHMVAKTPSPATTDKISTPVGNTGFTEEVGDKITWMASQGVQSASCRSRRSISAPSRYGFRCSRTARQASHSPLRTRRHARRWSKPYPSCVTCSQHRASR